jgi:hypothetical protein
MSMVQTLLDLSRLPMQCWRRALCKTYYFKAFSVDFAVNML